MDAYPNSKVILTTREPEKWFESMKSTIWAAPAVSELGKRVYELVWGADEERFRRERLLAHDEVRRLWVILLIILGAEFFTSFLIHTDIRIECEESCEGQRAGDPRMEGPGGVGKAVWIFGQRGFDNRGWEGNGVS